MRYVGPSSSSPRIAGWLMKTKGMAPVDVIKTTWSQDKLSHISQIWNRALGFEHNRRWFVIDFMNKIVTYTDSPKSKRVTFISFTDIMSAERITDPMKINFARQGWLNGVQLTTKERVYELWASSPQERDNWVAGFAQAISIARSQVNTQSASRSTSRQFEETPLQPLDLISSDFQ